MKKNKKGFTLAELLIVVAIIAVLTAVAVPLFVGALNKAEDAVKEANIRAVRGQAIAQILLADPDKDTEHTIYDAKTGTLKGPWYVTADVTENGEVKNLAVTNVVNKTATTAGTCTKDAKERVYKVVIKIEANALTLV